MSVDRVDGVSSERTLPPREVVLDGYRICRVLGHGGFSTVYLAEHEASGKRVALKISKTDNADRVTGLLQEAELLMRLNSPHIVRAFSSGYLSDGRGFIVCEWIDGSVLEQVAAAHRLSDAEVRNVALSIARGLQAIHRIGVIHRDVKARNVIVPIIGERLSYDAAKLIDLDIGETLVRAFNGIWQTSVGNLSGTMKYMSPEALSGRPQTQLTDIYALGLLVFELLYGNVPGASLKYKEVRLDKRGPRLWMGPFIQHRLTEEIELPQSGETSGAFNEFLIRSLRTKPHERFQSIDEAIAALQLVDMGIVP